MAIIVSEMVFQDVGAISDAAALSVDATAIVTYTIPASTKGVTFQNVGSKVAWLGGASTVDPSNNRGMKFFQNEKLTYLRVKATFTLGFKCAAGDSTTISIVTHT